MRANFSEAMRRYSEDSTYLEKKKNTKQAFVHNTRNQESMGSGLLCLVNLTKFFKKCFPRFLVHCLSGNMNILSPLQRNLNVLL